eukprot:TRINITY_DN10249_c0_g1_i1.p1 TRINITY_DN10249_c0_g1~~TRINITY_DN10249_c0_g1_i1.p1  ORF type:complete len:598 (-),score=155.09 TRINITY_DN10249_c0_g1_i1:28-1821(-)
MKEINYNNNQNIENDMEPKLMVYDKQAISRNWDHIYNKLREQKRSKEKRERERLKNAYEHLEYSISQKKSSFHSNFLEEAQDSKNCSNCGSTFWIGFFKKTCPLCFKNVCGSCFKKTLRLENPLYKFDQDQEDEFIDVNVCENCSGTVMSMKKFLSFKKDVESANEKFPLLIIQKQIRKQTDAISESMETLRLFVEDFSRKGGASPNMYHNANMARETVQKLFTALEKCKKQLMKEMNVSPTCKTVLNNMRLGLKIFLERALPSYKELNDKFVEIKIIEPKKNVEPEEIPEKKDLTVTINSVDPIYSPPEGTDIMISGTNFQNGVRVKIGGVHAKVHFVNSQELVVTSPPLQPGLKDILLINPDNTYCKKEPIILYMENEGIKEEPKQIINKPNKEISQPIVISVDPVMSPMNGTQIKLSGKNFAKGVKVYISGIPCETHFVKEDNSEYVKISFQSPKMLDQGIKEIRVENPDGKFFELKDVLIYAEIDQMMFTTPKHSDKPPYIVALNPTLTPLEGSMIQITAQHVVEGVIVKVEDIVCKDVTTKISYNDDVPSRIVFKSPSFSIEGMKNVTIINPDQNYFTLEQALYYTSNKELF